MEIGQLRIFGSHRFGFFGSIPAMNSHKAIRNLVSGSMPLLFPLLMLLNAIAAEEPGRVDPGFNAFTTSTPQYVPSWHYVAAIAEQPDGKVVFGGNFRVTASSYAQSYIVRAFPNGNVDPNFRVTVNGPVSEIAVHGDGSMIIAGDFSTVNGLPRRGIALIYDSGVVDVWFNPSSVPLNRVENVFRCANGTTVAKAWLTNQLGGIIKRVVRFNRLGALDPNFDVTVEHSYYSYPGSTYQYENSWRLVAATPRSWGNPPGADERLYVVGGFTSVNGISKTNIARLLPDGTVDSSFTPGVIPLGDRAQTYLTVQPDGRPIVAYGSNTIRVNLDGSVDESFNAGIGYFPATGSLYAQTDGRILVQGTAPAGIPRSHLWRLNANGTFDWSFHAGTGVTNTSESWIRDYLVVTPLTDRKIMVGGSFNGIDGGWRVTLGRLYGADLQPGPPKILKHPVSLALRETHRMALFTDVVSFEPPFLEWRKDGIPLAGRTNLSFTVESVSLADAGEYTVVFSNSVGAVTSTVARVTVDPPATGPGALDLQYAGTSSCESILNITIDRDDRALVSFNDNCTTVKPLRRLIYDGTVDLSFNVGKIVSGDGRYVYWAELTQNDEIQIGGYFDSVDGIRRDSIARLGPDGELDLNYAPNLRVAGRPYIRDSVIDPDGKTVIVGAFNSVNGISRWSLARLHRDGSLDASFNSANVLSNSNSRFKITQLPNGKYLLDATNRLNPDGTFDPLFHVGSIAGQVNATAVLTNGDILIAGSFTNVSSLPRNLIARLRALDGLVDPSFQSPPLFSLPEGGIYGMALQPDGKIVIAGRFSIGANSPVSNTVARLNPNGALDTTFSLPIVEGTENSTYYPRVEKVAIQSDGGILVGGDFTMVNGYPRTNLARLNGDRVIAAAAPTAQTGSATNVTFLAAALAGSANPQDAATRVYFEYGATTSYGSATAIAKLPAGTNEVAVTLNASNLLADTTYHYRIVATNRMGVAFGEDREFTTTSRPAEPQISGHTLLGNGGLEFTFTGDSGRSYTVMMSTNLIDWTEAGIATETGSGNFKFTDGQTASPISKFYRLRTP